MIEPFTSWLSFQEEMIAFQQAQIQAARKALENAGDMTAAQEAMKDATEAQARAWKSWLDMWGMDK